MKINSKKCKLKAPLLKSIKVLFLTIFLLNPAISKEFAHPGGTKFNVQDRLAIINLVNSYADDYDHNNFEEYLRLFTKDIKCTVYLNDSDPITVQSKQFIEMMRGFRLSAIENQVSPLHFITNLNVKEQTKNKAVVETYVIYVPLDAEKLHLPKETLNNTNITGTARYIFTVIKDIKNIWKIDSYIIKYKQSVVEKTLP